MDIVQATNATEPVVLAGRAYPVRQLKLREWGELHAWLRSTQPGPVAVALRSVEECKALGFPPTRELVDRVLAAAYDESRSWPPPVGSNAWLSAIDRADGGNAKFVAAAVRAGGTPLTDAEAADLAEAATAAELAELLRVAYFGDPPPPPKGEAPPAGPAPAGPPETAPDATTGGRSPTGWSLPAAGPTPTSPN